MDSQRFYVRITVKTTVCPNFKSKELREAYKTEDPMEVAKRVLSVSGEYDNWLNKATENDLEDLEEESKNE